MFLILRLSFFKSPALEEEKRCLSLHLIQVLKTWIRCSVYLFPAGSRKGSMYLRFGQW